MSRGGGWVAAQVVLITAIGLSALVGESPGVLGYVLGGVLLAAGAALLGAGGRDLGSSLTPFPEPRPGGALQTAGLYGRVRHPMYGGGILVAAGWSALFATLAGLVLTALLAAFFELKSRREERRLEQAYPGYRAYRQRVRRRFIPFLW